MALSIISIPGDGVTDTFTVSFALGILDRTSTTAWVTGEVDGGGNKVYRTITYLSDTLLKISGTPAGVGVMVVFTRTVSQTALIVNYEDGDIMNETNLNTAQKQALMLVHQVLDGRFSAFIRDVSAGGFKITNLGTPTAATDAATRGYVDSVVATGAVNAAAAAVSAAAALASQNAVAASQDTASTSASTATTQAGIATTQAGISTTQAGISTTQAGLATTARNYANLWATQAEDVAVNDGVNPSGFSAFHWAQKALSHVVGSIAPVVHGATNKAVILDADETMLVDSADSWAFKKITFTNLKAFLKTYFDTLYGGLGTTNTWYSTNNFSGTTSFPAHTGSTTLSSGTGNGASYTTFNTKLHGHFGLGMEDHSSAINGYYDFRLGKWDVKNGYYVNTVRIPFQSQFVSAQQTITAAGALTLAHGLGTKPLLHMAFIQCVVAEHGYSVGDEIGIALSTSNYGGYGIAVVPDATNLVVRFGQIADPILITHKTTGGSASATSTKWKLVVRAWA